MIAAMIETMDTNVGRLLAAREDLGEWHSMIVEHWEGSMHAVAK